MVDLHPYRHPIAYDRELFRYVTRLRAQIGKNYWRGSMRLRIRHSTRGNPHFWDVDKVGGWDGSGGGGGGPESVLHIFMKQCVADNGYLLVCIDGNPVFLGFNDAKVEQRLDNRTPDVTATLTDCYPAYFTPGSKILIEVHVTNDVKLGSERWIQLRSFGFPVIEITPSAEMAKTELVTDVEGRGIIEYAKIVHRDLRFIPATWINPDELGYPQDGRVIVLPSWTRVTPRSNINIPASA